MPNLLQNNLGSRICSYHGLRDLNVSTQEGFSIWTFRQVRDMIVRGDVIRALAALFVCWKRLPVAHILALERGISPLLWILGDGDRGRVGYSRTGASDPARGSLPRTPCCAGAGYQTDSRQRSWLPHGGTSPSQGYLGTPPRAILRFRHQDAPTPPSPLVG